MAKKTKAKEKSKSAVFGMNGRKYLQITRGEGAFITVDLTLIKENLNKRFVELGYMTQEEANEANKKPNKWGI